MKKEEERIRKEDEIRAEKLEEKIALSLINPKKGPKPPPYPPGTRYGLISRHGLS